MKLAHLILEHLLPSLLIGVIGWYVFDQWTLILTAILTGWLIDVDHFLDLWLAVRYLSKDELKKSGGFKKMISTGEYFRRNGRIIVFLHSWELIGFWFLLWQCIGNTPMAVIGSTAWAVHLIIDHLSYNLSPWAYFFSYRLGHGFALNAVSWGALDS